jgi:hypothetical protein
MVEVLMVTNLSNWIGTGIGGASAVSVEQGALAYLMVSLLGPLSWMLVVEICRRARASRGEQQSAPGSPAVARLALPLARLKTPVSPSWWAESRPEEN